MLAEILLKFIPIATTDDKPAWFHNMVWDQSGNKSLSGPMMTYFVET